MRSTIVLLAMVLLAPWAAAEQKQVIGDWEVHYNAFNSTFISPEVASQYQLTRSEKRGLVNIAVLDSQSGQAVAAAPSGYVTNPRGGVQALDFIKITEADAVYYLASFLFGNKETMRFTIKFPQSASNRTLNFEQQLYQE